MASGYQMASKAFERDLAHIPELKREDRQLEWPFSDLLRQMTDPRDLNREGREMLAALQRASISPG